MSASQIHYAGGYGSEFEYDSEAERKKQKYKDLVPKKKKTTDGVAHKRELEDEYSKEEGKAQRFQILSMDAYTRHKKFVNDYIRYYCGSKDHFQRDTSHDKTDMDVIRENHRFLWTEDDESDETWEKKLAKKYYDKLFKEYCITDLSRYKENKVAMRWRIEKEVIDGKGQFICGNKKCKESEGLRSWEVNFAYMEHGEKKNALVKLRLCPDCSYKLNYHHRKKEILPKSKKKKEKESSHSSTKRRKHEEYDKELSPHRTESAETSTHETDKSKKMDPEEEKSIWSGPAKITEDKSREEEFDDYFEDMFL